MSESNDNKERSKKEQDLKVRAIQTLVKTQSLKLEAQYIHTCIIQFTLNYPEHMLDKMDWLEREKVLAEADVLFEQMQECEEMLKRVDAEYEALRQEVNEFYGKEVMGKVISDDFFEELSLDAEPPDDADWWKK